MRLDRGAVVAVLVALGQVHGHAQRAAARNDRHLVDRVVLGHDATDDRMASLVVGGELLLVVAHRHRTALGAHHDLVARLVEVVHADVLRVLAGGKQRRLIDQVGQVGTAEARGTARDGHRHDVIRQRHLAHVHAQDLLAATHVRQPDHDLAVESARTQQRGIQHVGTVGRRDDDHALAALEAVHLDQQLVQGLLALVMTAAQTGTAMATDRVDLVDEDDARRALLGLLEHVTHAAGADADEHLDEVRAGDREERHLGLAGDRAGEQGLTRARGADHQHAARDLAAQLLEARRVAQELDQLADLLLGFVATGHVGQGHLDLVLALQLGARLAEAHRALATALLHLLHDKQPERDDQQDRQEVQQDRPERRAARRHLLDADVVLHQVVDQVLVTGAEGGELRAVLALAGDRGAVLVDAHLVDAVGLDLLDELVIGQRASRAGGAWAERLEHHHENHGDDHPEHQILGHVVHRIRITFFVRTACRGRHRRWAATLGGRRVAKTGSLDLCAFALCQGVDLRGALARRFRLADRYLGITPPQFPHVIIEPHALEQLDQERAIDTKEVVGKIHRQLRQVKRTRHVDRVHTTLIGGHIGENKVHGFVIQSAHQLR